MADQGGGGKPSVPSALGAPGQAQLRGRAPVTLSQASSGQRLGVRARARGLLPLPPLSDHLSEALAQVKTRGRRRGAPLAGNQRVPALRDPPAPCPPRLPLGSTPGARASPGFSELRSAERRPAPAGASAPGPGSGSARPRPGLRGRGGQVTGLGAFRLSFPATRALAADSLPLFVCLSSLHLAYDSSSRRKMRSPEPRAVLRTWSLARAYQRHRGSGDNPRRRARLRDPAQDAAGRLPAPGHERQSQAGAFRGAAIRNSARRDVATPGPRENRLSEPFQSAHNKCARHRMHHLPPQIRALMGRQIAVRGGHAGRPVPRRQPACPPAGGTRV
eukprot:XP_022262547.1 uncharacterized protein LOC111089996 [Canis lupus familiaris]